MAYSTDPTGPGHQEGVQAKPPVCRESMLEFQFILITESQKLNTSCNTCLTDTLVSTWLDCRTDTENSAIWRYVLPSFLLYCVCNVYCSRRMAATWTSPCYFFNFFPRPLCFITLCVGGKVGELILSPGTDTAHAHSCLCIVPFTNMHLNKNYPIIVTIAKNLGFFFLTCIGISANFQFNMKILGMMVTLPKLKMRLLIFHKVLHIFKSVVFLHEEKYWRHSQNSSFRKDIRS